MSLTALKNLAEYPFEIAANALAPSSETENAAGEVRNSGAILTLSETMVNFSASSDERD